MANRGVVEDSYLPAEELLAAPGVPSWERITRGPVAVIECTEEIPCDPCQRACRLDAITVPTIISVPVLDSERCNGCGACIARCPGLAIFVVDYTFSETEGAVWVPYEFLPRPVPGGIVQALDRTGQPVCEARVLTVREARSYDRTCVVTLTVPKNRLMEVRAFKVSTPKPEDVQ